LARDALAAPVHIRLSLKSPAAKFPIPEELNLTMHFCLIFGIFKGYVVCVCIFSLLNWFYPHKNWPIKTEGTYSFEMVYKVSEFLIEEFPKSDEYYDDTKEKIENI
jgi:hypothetical protein